MYQKKKYQLNLWKANELQFLDAGVKKENIHLSGLCTCCNPKLLYSHRASKGKRGNLNGFISLSSGCVWSQVPEYDWLHQGSHWQKYHDLMYQRSMQYICSDQHYDNKVFHEELLDNSKDWLYRLHQKVRPHKLYQDVQTIREKSEGRTDQNLAGFSVL